MSEGNDPPCENPYCDGTLKFFVATIESSERDQEGNSVLDWNCTSCEFTYRSVEGDHWSKHLEDLGHNVS